MISFLNPLYLLLLPLGALPIILNLIKRRVRLRLRFPSVQLLKIIEERRARRRPSWREVLLLVVRVAAIVFLVLALAGPRFTPRGASPPRAVVVVIDNSPSMTYVDEGGERLGRAVRYAHALGAAASAEDVGAVLWTGSAAKRLEWGRLGDVAAAVAKVPTAEGRLADALAAASRLFAKAGAEGRNREVAVFTDMQDAAFKNVEATASSLSPGVGVTFYDVRAEAVPAWNAAVAGAQVFAGAEDTFDVNLDVRQYGKPRPLAVEEVGGRAVADVAAAARAKVRFSVPGGRRYEFRCRGGYPFDDYVTVSLPPTAGVSYAVAPATPGGRLWEAVFAAVRAEPAPGDLTTPPGVYVMPLSAWRASARAPSWAERGFVVVVVPDGAAGGRFDDGTTVARFERAEGPVSAAAAVLPNAASAGSFQAAGVMALATSAPWQAAAVTADGRPFVATRRIGKGDVFLLCAPVGRRYTNFYTSAAFVGFVLDLKLRALTRAYPDFAPARAFISAESNPKAITEDELRRLFPGAVVTRHEPRGRGRASVPLQAPAAATVFLLLAAEALIASRRSRE
jgi:hypothetical protein